MVQRKCPLLDYPESFPHRLLQAFLQRLLNGGGRVHREAAFGRKRVDLCIDYKNQRFLLELKIKRDESSLKKGLEQIVQYRDYCQGAEAHLLIFDTKSIKSWEEKISDEQIEYSGQQIHIWTF